VIFALFFLWIGFTLLDLIISGLALHFGAREVGLLFILSNDFQLMCLIKGVASFLFGLILVVYRQKGLLAISCGIYVLLCAWNGQVLHGSMSH